jgi:preprotein translocase subunit YajC
MLSMLLTSGSGSQASGGSIVMTLVMVALWIGVLYFIMIRPQKKQQKEMDSLRNSVKAGDNIMTTGGFYGVVLDVVDDTVIVEFGNNKNCRIPMHKNAIAEVERKGEEQTEE